MKKELLQPYIGKEVNLKIRGASHSDVFLSEVNDNVIAFISFNHNTKKSYLNFVDINEIFSFSVSETIIDDSHQKYIEKYNVRQTFK